MLRNVQIWVVLSWKLVVLLIITNSVFKFQNVQIWTVTKCKVVFLLIVRNGIFRLQNFQIRAVPPCKRVNLLMLRNRVFTVRNVEICAVLSSMRLICRCSGIAFSSSETIRKVQCSIEWSKFPDTKEFCFEAWKSSDIACSTLLCGRIVDSQESFFQASKRSNMGSAVLECGRSADIHEFCVQAANVQIWTVSNCKGVYFRLSGLAFSSLKIFS